MVRHYRRKHPRDPVRRMAIAARLTADGLSLRQVAKRLSVSHQTVANDLARWEREKPHLPLEIIRLSKPAVKNMPPGGDVLTPRFDSPEPNVVPLWRTS